jgi:site-specific DNA recombinase
MSEKHSTAGRPRVAVYYRMSTDAQEESIDRQKSQVGPHCEKQGYAVAAEEADEGISGSEVGRRSGLQRLLALARAGKIDGIVVDDLKRLARLDSWDMAELLNPLRKAGVWVETVARGRMSYDKIGRLLLTLEGEGGNEQLQDTARNVLTKHLKLARDMGRPPRPKCVYGYRRSHSGQFDRKKDGRLVPLFDWSADEVTSAVVRTIFEWFAGGRSLGWISQELHRRGVASPGGSEWWHRTTIRQILKNPIYVGRRAWGKTSQGMFFRQRAGQIEAASGSRKAEWHPQENWFTTDDTPALVGPDLWDAVQRRFARRTPPTPRLDAEAFLLSGLLVCGRCGGTLAGSSVRPAAAKQGIFYVCCNYTHKGLAGCVRNEAKEDWAVRQIITELRDRLLLPDRLEWLRDQLEKRAKEQRSDGSLTRLRKAVATLEAKLARCRSRLVDVSKDMVPEVEAQIRATREQLEAARNELHAAETADPVKELKVTVDAAREALYRLETALEGDNRCLLKEALRGILSGVVIGAEPYQTTTGKTRHRARIDGICLRPGSGLDTLSMLSSCSSASTR